MQITYPSTKKTRQIRKMIKMSGLIGMLLVLLVESSNRTDSDISTDFFGNKYKELLSYSILESKHLEAELYKNSKSSFTLIKDLSYIYEYFARSSDILVGEGSALDYLSKKCLLSISYPRISKDLYEKNESIIRERTPIQSEKKLFVMPYSATHSHNNIISLNNLKNNYFNEIDPFFISKPVIAYTKSVFSQIFYKKYIECGTLPSKHKKDKIASFTAFLEENDITQGYLEEIEIEDPFIYIIVNQFELYNREEKEKKQLYHSAISESKQIEEIFQENKILRKIYDTNPLKVDKTYKEDAETISSMVKEEGSKYDNCNLEHFLKSIKKETLDIINHLISRNILLHSYIRADCLGAELKKSEKFKKEGAVVIEILYKMEKTPNGCVSIEGLTKELEKEVKKRYKEKEQEKIAERIYTLTNEVRRNLTIELNLEGMQSEALPWDVHLIEILLEKAWYTPGNKSLEEVKKEFAEINNRIVSELEERREQIYSEYMLGVWYWRVFEENIQKIEPLKSILNTVNLSIFESFDEIDIVLNKIDTISMWSVIDAVSYILAYDANYKGLPEVEKRKKISEKRDLVYNIVFDAEIDLIIYDNHNDRDQNRRENIQKILSLESSKEVVVKEENIKRIVNCIRQVISMLIDSIVDNERNIFSDNHIKEAKMTFKKTEESIKKISSKNITYNAWNILNSTNISFLLEHHFKWVAKNKRTNRIYQRLINSTAEKDFSSRSSLDEMFWKCITKTKPDSIYAILLEFCLINKYLAFMKSYNELWKNPAFLIIKPGYNDASQKEEKKAYIIYKPNIFNAEFYEKEVELSDTILNAFKNAKTLQEIEGIPGEFKGVHIWV